MRVRPLQWLGILSLISCAPIAWCEGIRIGAMYTSAERVELQLELTNPRAGLQAPSLLLVEDGVATVPATQLKAARDTDRGLAAVIAVDVSGSMRRGPLEDAKNGLRAHVAEFASRDSVALLSFASDLKWDSDFGAPQRPELMAAIGGLQARGKSTLLYDALSKAIDSLSTAKALRRRVIVISDGLDEKSGARIEDVIQRAQKFGVAIDAIGRGSVSEDYSNSLYRLAKESGGLYLYAGAGEMSEKIKTILDQIESMPVAFFARTVNPSGAKTRKLAVEIVSSGSAPEISEEIAMAIPATLLQTPPSTSFPWAFVIIGVLVIVIVVVFVLVRRKKEDANEDTTVIDIPPPPVEPDAETLEQKRRARQRHTVFDRAQESPVSEVRTPSAPIALRIISGPLEGKTVAIRNALFRIGAADDNDLPMSQDEWVSGHHAQIHYRQGKLTIQDVGSRHGTSVNGQKITGAQTLAPGNTIQVGNSVLQVVAEGQAATSDTVR